MVDSIDSKSLMSDTTARQMLASSPQLSAWVSANAGSGKTHVLSQRVVRLLLNGTRPSAILCLTYTKAAAAEMSNRIFKILADWTVMGDSDLSDTLFKLEGRQPDQQTLSAARRLFANALETPGGLKIQTIHAFCEALLHRFPLEANVPGHFEVLDDISAINMLKEARRQILTIAASDPQHPIAIVVRDILDLSGEHGLGLLLDEIIAKRHALSDFWALAEQKSGLSHYLADKLKLDPHGCARDDLDGIWPIDGLTDQLITSYYDLAHQASQTTPQKIAQILVHVQNAPDAQTRFDLLYDGFLTKSGVARKMERAVTADIEAILPQMPDMIAHIQEHILTIEDVIKRRKCLAASVSAMTLAKHFIDMFEGLKRRQAKLDYDDLIIKTAHLFQRRGAGSWVHYKLDRGIDHILVDEAQDTSPNQWALIQSLAGEFYAGETARSLNRTMFAVGDEKQSIYSFQGAKPERFHEEQRETRKRADQAQKAFKSIALRVSFRSTADVLDMVDLVFADDLAKKGLSFSDPDIIHQSVRQKAPGSVELWDMIAKKPATQDDDWLAAFDSVNQDDPVRVLSQQIAATLKSWIGQETIIDHKTGIARLISAGDILILVRKRDSFVPTLMRVLKSQTHIPVAGADRLRLTDHIAVKDLIALGRVVLLKEDDLALSSLLKSPFFDVSEDQLFALCAKRQPGQSVWQHLCLLAQDNEFWQQIAQSLTAYKGFAEQFTVHDFYAYLLGPMGLRQKFLNRNGSEVTDILDGFLDAALEHDQAGGSGLQSFIANLEQTKPDIKREQEQGLDAVRIMTVHASKGLEAPIVFLVDPGSAPYHASHANVLLKMQNPDHQTHLPASYLWLPKAAYNHSISRDIRRLDEEKAEEEYRRLLYVGLTRAADRLVVCGYRGINELKKPTWHQLVANGFDRAPQERVQTIVREMHGARASNNEGISEGTGQGTGEGTELTWQCRVFQNSQNHLGELQTRPDGPTAQTVFARPDCLDQKPATDKAPPRPLIPSGVGTIIEDRDHLPSDQSPFLTPDPCELSGADYGKAVHRLLQVLPQMPPETWHMKGLAYLTAALPQETSDTHQLALQNVIDILTTDKWAALFNSEYASEFSVMGSILLGDEERLVSGRIDRLVNLPDRVLILDYKTNRHAPLNVHAVPEHYVKQLAIYREVLKPLYADKTIEAALLFTRAPRLLELSAPMLDHAMKNLAMKDLAEAQLCSKEAEALERLAESTHI